MTQDTTSIPRVSLLIDEEGIGTFTTLLQAGILLEARQGVTLGELLTSLPGFNPDYIRQRVQTLFINGLPADDLEQQLFGFEVVVAVSAAMPGLAGAIFRKNGPHASLRTSKAENRPAHLPDASTPIKIRLKLFNAIGVERGQRLLQHGCRVSGSTLAKFLTYRHNLASRLKTIEGNGQPLTHQELLALVEGQPIIELTVKISHDS